MAENPNVEWLSVQTQGNAKERIPHSDPVTVSSGTLPSDETRIAVCLQMPQMTYYLSREDGKLLIQRMAACLGITMAMVEDS